MATLATIIAAYKRDHQANAAAEQRWFAMQRSLKDAVERAALAQMPSGKRFSHQRRIPLPVLKEAQRILLASLDRLEAARTFAELHATAAELVGAIHGIGELYIYDTALRIGAWRKLAPAKVYVHAGVRKGARNLGLDVDADGTIAIKSLPKPLRCLPPCAIEDILCIYKGQLAGAAMTARQSACFGARPRRQQAVC